MTIFVCISQKHEKCPKMKTGQPYKASGEKRWLCNYCEQLVEVKQMPATLSGKAHILRVRKHGG